MKLTTIGAAKLAVALAGGAPIALASLAVGDSNGTPYAPTGAETALVHEVCRVPLETLEQDPLNPPWARAVGVIPAATAGFFIREIAIIDAAGALFAIGRYPDTYKPLVAEGASFDAPITAIMQVGSVSALTIVLDPSAVYATRDFVLSAADFFAVKSATTTAPPASPTVGDKYLVPAGASGVWAGRAGTVAIYRNVSDGWLHINAAIAAGARAADTAVAYRRDATGWRTAAASLTEHLAGTDATLGTTPAGVAAMIAAGIKANVTPDYFNAMI
ncbi:phage tail-collar fiber domain-containing protein [Methylobacterium planeticum]|nr:phage tail protein [Methylobacterium planeticum]